MSNKFNKLTQQLTRPKVCKSIPPERLAGECATLPETRTVELGAEATFAVKAWNDALPDDQPVGMSVTPQISTVSLKNNPVNDNAFTGEFELSNLTTTGHEIITVKITFSDNTVCFLFPEVTWIPL